MSQQTLASHEIEFVQELYNRNFTQGMTHMPFRDWCTEKGLDHSETLRNYERITDSGLVKSAGLGMMLRISPTGISHIERNRLANIELIKQQDECRKTILQCGVDVYEIHGKLGLVFVKELETKVSVQPRVLHANLFLLRDWSVIETMGMNYSLTSRGHELVAALNFREKVEAQWAELTAGETMSPQARGHALEELIAEQARNEGMAVDTRVRSNGEENDLVLSQGHLHFLVSCKWENGRAPAHYLDTVRIRIQKRPGTLGVLVSVGGFSEELIREAESNTSLGLVMLLGKGDLKRLFEGKEQLNNMLIDRHTALARYRRVLFEL